MNKLSVIIRKTYGSQRNLAKQLGVSEQTVTNWVQRNPYAMLKHCNAMRDNPAVDVRELLNAIEERENAIIKDKPS